MDGLKRVPSCDVIMKAESFLEIVFVLCVLVLIVRVVCLLRSRDKWRLWKAYTYK
jgi:hypothetical protein